MKNYLGDHLRFLQEGKKAEGKKARRKKLTGGRWVMIHGHPVYIKKNKVRRGLPDYKGTSEKSIKKLSKNVIADQKGEFKREFEKGNKIRGAVTGTLVGGPIGGVVGWYVGKGMTPGLHKRYTRKAKAKARVDSGR